MDKSGSDKTTAGAVCSSVGDTERSFLRKAFSIICYVVVLFGDRTKLIGEPDFVRELRIMTITSAALFTIQRGTGRISVSIIGKNKLEILA